MSKRERVTFKTKYGKISFLAKEKKPTNKATVEEIHKHSLKEWKKKCNCIHCPVIEYLYSLRDANAKK